jgi:hypothetical protein
MVFPLHGTRCARRLVSIASLFDTVARVSRIVTPAQLRVIFDTSCDFIFLSMLKRDDRVVGLFPASHDVALAIPTGREMNLFPDGEGIHSEAVVSWRVAGTVLAANARRSGAQCRIGFQPVSGRTTRHPQTTVLYGTGIIPKTSSRGQKDRLEACATLRRRVIAVGSWRCRHSAVVTSPSRSIPAKRRPRSMTRTNPEIAIYAVTLGPLGNIPRYSQNPDDVCHPQIPDWAQNLAVSHFCNKRAPNRPRNPAIE